VLLGDAAFIKQARRVRKVMGGGMRQAGYLAAAGLFAMENNINRLAEDHVHAKQLASALADCNWVGEIFPVETNIVIFEVASPRTVAETVAALSAQNIRVSAMSDKHIRMVTHLDVSEIDIDYCVNILEKM
jgi:threonine aldolase